MLTSASNPLITAAGTIELCFVADHLGEIEAFRESLPANKRQCLNHPEVLARHVRRQMRAPRPRREPVIGTRQRCDGRPVFWPQARIRAAADAMRESRSTDFVIMARAALEGGIRSEADLIELLENDAPTRTPPKRRAMPAEAAAALA